MPVLDQYKTMFSFLPKSILSSQLDTLKTMPDGDIKLWIKYCRGDKLSPKEIKKAENTIYLMKKAKPIRMQYQ